MSSPAPSRPAPMKSTIVRALAFSSLRMGFMLGSRVAPGLTVRRAARLFCTPVGSSRPAPEALQSATAGAIDVDGQRLATWTWGDPSREPYVLFAHGWASHGLRLAAWLPALRAAGYAVVGVDQVGHGRSPGRRATLPGFVRVLREVGRRHGPAAAVIGHSLGGIAATLAISQGLEAQRVVLIAPAADPVDAAHRFARTVGFAQHLCQRMFALFEAQLGTRYIDQQAHRAAPYIARPALVVHDLEDRDVPWSEGESYARHWPDARLVSTRGLGHRRILDDPSVIAAGVAFLRGATVGERVVSSPNLPFGIA